MKLLRFLACLIALCYGKPQLNAMSSAPFVAAVLAAPIAYCIHKSSLYRTALSYGWGSKAFEKLEKQAQQITPQQFAHRRPDLTAPFYKPYVTDHQLPEESQKKIDAIMQKESVMRALTLLYNQPNIVQYVYANYLFWRHGIRFTGSHWNDMTQYIFDHDIPIQHVFTIKGLNFYFKMGNLYHQIHTDAVNLGRIINAQRIRNQAQLDNIHFIVPQKYFYDLQQQQNQRNYFPPFLVVAQAIDLSKFHEVPHDHPIHGWFNQELGMVDLHNNNLRYTSCTTCTKKCMNQLQHDTFIITDTEF